MHTYHYRTPEQEAEEARKAAEEKQDRLCDLIQEIDTVFATTPREELPDEIADNLRRAKDEAEKEFFSRDIKWLLKEVTARYNAEVEANYHRGELDFIPKGITTDKMLDIALIEYAQRHYPDILL